MRHGRARGSAEQRVRRQPPPPGAPADGGVADEDEGSAGGGDHFSLCRVANAHQLGASGIEVAPAVSPLPPSSTSGAPLRSYSSTTTCSSVGPFYCHGFYQYKIVQIISFSCVDSDNALSITLQISFQLATTKIIIISKQTPLCVVVIQLCQQHTALSLIRTHLTKVQHQLPINYL